MTELTDRIRSEAAQAVRPGQASRLEAIAEEVERLQRGARTLGEVIERQGRMILDITGLHDWIDEDGDGDWGAVWENAYALLPRITEADDRIESAREVARLMGAQASDQCEGPTCLGCMTGRLRAALGMNRAER